MKIINTYILPLSLTLILVGYITVWHPSPMAGLNLIGWEIGEWVKFLPAFIQGNPPTNRHWFYIPPITVAASMICSIAVSCNRSLHILLGSSLAIPIAFLAVPDIPIILNEPYNQWLIRLIWFGMICALLLVSPLLKRLPGRAYAMILLGYSLWGMILPAAAYQATRWHITNLTDKPATIGIGLLLNSIGHLLLFMIASYFFILSTRKRAYDHH